MRKIYLLFVSVMFTVMVNAQIPVTVSGTAVTTPALAGSYTSLANALTALNLITAYPTPGTIIFTCTGGTSETSVTTGLTIGSATLNPLLSSTNTVTIINGGGGAVTLNAAVGAAASPSATPDCILKLTGADYVTIDGLTFTDANSASATVAMEVGLGFFKLNAGDGCNNNTVQNCIFNMQRISNGGGTTPMLDGSWAIEVVNSTATAAITSLTPTNGGTLASNGTNSGNKFYANTINNGNGGIGFGGYAATLGVGPSPTATTFLGDLGNDVGGVALATGNSILNFGGGAATSASAGIRANNQWSVNISYNTVNNNNGGGVNHATTLRGIYAQAGASANATINNNTITMQSGATTSTLNAIENAIGSTAAANTININTNIIRLAYTTATSGVMGAIVNSATAATVNINNNNIQGVAATNYPSTGTVPLIVCGSPGGTLNVTGNTISNFTMTGISGTLRAITASTPTGLYAVTGNTIENLSYITSASTGSITGIYNLASATLENINSNIIRNFSTPTTGTLNGIQNNTVTGTFQCRNNQIYNFTTTAGGAGGFSANGITWSNANVDISGNIIYSINSTGTTGGTGGTINGITHSGAATVTGNAIYDLSSNSTNVVITGININASGTNTISNNLIGDLRATASTGNVSISGINAASGTTNNIFHNTVNITSTTTSLTTFGTSAIYFSSSTPVNNLRNNIFVNTSTPGPTGGFTAAIRYTIAPTTTNFPVANNNNFYYAGVAAANKVLYCEGSSAAPTNGQQTIANYKTYISVTLPASGRESASVSEVPNFVSTTGSNPITTFLKYNTGIATQIEQGGGLGTGISTDYAGTTRCPGGGCPGAVATPDMGAWELNGLPLDLSAPAISYTALSNSCATGARTLTASITDASGVPTSGLGLPVAYFKINAGAYTPVTATFVSGSTYTFSIGAGSVSGDVVSYYIVAQDNAGTPNVGAFPSGGAGGFTINPPAASTPPTTPSSYTNLAILAAGIYGVGGPAAVGEIGHYATLTLAVADYNAKCLGGNIIFALTDAGYTTAPTGVGEVFPITINANPAADATHTLTIKPDAGVTATITGSSASGLIVLNGADYVTIDGSNGSTANTVCPPVAATRDLTITNTNTGTTSAVVWLQTTAGADAATNNTVKNCILVGNSNTTTLFGVGSGSSTIGLSSLGSGNNNNSFVNNNISKTQWGIYSQGASAASKNTGNTINQNLINTVSPNNVAKGGIVVGFENNITISGNNVSEIAQTSSPDVFGITLGVQGISTSTFTGNEVTNATVTKNVIGSIRNTGTFSAGGIVVAPATSGTNLIANNMLSGVSANGTSGDFTVGILIGGGAGSTTQVYYNTVSMSGTQTGGSDKSYALAIGGSNPTVDIRNNILVNTQNNGTGINYAIGYGYSTFTNLTSDHNDYYVATGGTYSIGATGSISAPTSQPTILNLQTATGKDGNAQNVLPAFTSATNLHLVTPDANNFNLESTGVAVSVTDDIDCATRPSGGPATAPDIGADEFAGALPSCNIPTAVSVGSITTTTASVSFTCTGCTGTYIVEFGLPGFTPGIAGTAGAGGTIVTGAASPIGLTGLSSATTYDVYVRQDCGLGSYSANSTLVQFTTLCSNGTLPFNEGFNTSGTAVFPTCWSQQFVVNTSNLTFQASSSNPTTTPFEGTRYVNWNSFSIAAGNETRLVSRGITTTGTASVDVNFRWFNENNTTYSSGLYLNEGVQVQYSTDGTTWTDVTGGFFARHDGSLTAGTGAWKLKTITLPAAAGNQPTIYVGFKFHSEFGDNCSLDAVNVDATPACPAPSQPTMSAITATSATATWPNAGSFILEYGPTGYTPGTAGTAGVTGTLIDPAVSPQALSGLTASTTYDLYVRQVCAGPSWSANSPVRTFTTLAAPPANDEASGAITLTIGAGCTGAPYTNVAATSGASEPYPSCSGVKQTPVWFKFVAPASGAVRISTDLGTAPGFTDSKVGLFSGTDAVGYTDFSIISCDDDGGSVIGSGFMSVVYATGLTPGTTYYIAVDKFSSGTTSGTFCIAVDELNASMLSTTNTCASSYQIPGGSVSTYTQWVPLLDASSKLIALVRNPAGGNVSSYSTGQNINTGAVRSYGGVYYLDRNTRIANSSATNVQVQFFFLTSELTALTTADPSVTLATLAANRQTETVSGCYNNFSPANGTTTQLTQTVNGTSTDGLVKWIQVLTPGFSNFYLGGPNQVLPAGLLSFSGYKDGSRNQLRWTTVTEVNNSGFEVQRSTDGINYTSLGFVNSLALGGNSTIQLNYAFTDNSVTGSRQYYRLRQVDFDNHSKLSNIVLIKGEKPVSLTIDGLFPNPASTLVNVLIASPSKDKVTLVVTDIAGRTVIQKIVNMETGSNTIPVDINRLTNGTYLVKLVCSSNCESAVGKFVKQ